MAPPGLSKHGDAKNANLWRVEITGLGVRDEYGSDQFHAT